MTRAPLWIKICANTSLEDALLAAALGADAVGFVFAPSPRQVDAAQVARITPHLPPTLERVGVFLGSTPQDLETIAQAAEQSGLTAIQLHGGSNPCFAAALHQRLGPAVSIIHTAHWTVGQDEESARALSAQMSELEASPNPGRLLIDARLGSHSGGLGVSFDWSAAHPVLAAHPGLKVIVAGGLRPDNVTQAIRQLQPYGIDVASGVEQSPGKKDPIKLKAFLQAARAALSSV